MLCSGLTNEIQCLIVITRKDLALRTKTNQRASSKENRMEVRLVTAASRGFFFSLAWITIAASPLTIAALLRKKTPSGTQGSSIASFVWNQCILNFEVVAERDITLRSRLSKKHLSRDFYPF